VSFRAEQHAIRTKEANMFSESDYQIVVTYRDGNLVWKDRAVDQKDITATTVRPDEREVTCFIPTFWSSVPRSSRIEHVGITAKGRTFQLPWPPPALAPIAPPALAMRIRVHYKPDATPASVNWEPRELST
jgi:hypothetical protein